MVIYFVNGSSSSDSRRSHGPRYGCRTDRNNRGDRMRGAIIFVVHLLYWPVARPSRAGVRGDGARVCICRHSAGWPEIAMILNTGATLASALAVHESRDPPSD